MTTKLSPNAELIAKKRYFQDGEDWSKCSYRVASTIAAIEKEKEKYTNKFHEIISNMDFIPAGRILRNSGLPKGNLLNCFNIPVDDSRVSIGEHLKHCLITWGTGGGIGCNWSSVRPANSPILTSGGFASGPVSFLEAADAVAATIESGGQRRSASIACLDVSHPDIEKFIDAKIVQKKLPHFNISVLVNNEFLEAVEKDTDWELKFKYQSYGKIKARKLWDNILSNMLKYAEPGLLNSTNLYKNNSYYFAPITSTNPCQPFWAPVLTPKGISTIGNINIGDIIWSKDSWVTVTNKTYSGVKEVYKFRTNSGVFYGTNEHRIVSYGKKIEVQYAESIDSLTGNGTYTSNILPEVVMDGLVIGDGSVHKASNDFVHLDIGQSDHDYFASEISNLIIGKKSIGPYSYAVITNIQAEELPLTFNRKIPDRYIYGDASTVCSFLRGLYSANGSIISSGGRLALKSASKILIEQVQIMLSSIGILSYYTTNKEHEVEFKNGTYQCKESYDINITQRKSLEIFRDNIGFIQNYRTEALNIIIQKKPLVSNSKYTYNIHTKEFVSTEDVFDITVSGNSHTYWSGGCNISNCSELPLENYAACDLGSLVLPHFVTDTGRTNWKHLEDTINLAIRFLDNVLDVTTYELNEINTNVHNSRRVGLGCMGLAEYFFMKNIRYGSEESLLELEKLLKFIRNISYTASISLAVEKSSFPKFDPVAYGKASFIRKLPASIRRDIKTKGIRNTTIISWAPTGTISLLPEVSSGCEPLFARAFLRNDRVSSRLYIHPIYLEYIKNNKELPDWYVDAYDLTPENHFEIQTLITQYTDNSVSKTINLPKDTDVKQLNSLLLEYLYNLKGVTVYRDGSREGQVLTRLPHEEVLKAIADGKVETGTEQTRCHSGTCEL